jgi:hypothetical protein
MEGDILDLLVEAGDSYKRQTKVATQRDRASSAGTFRAGDVFKRNIGNSSFSPLFRSMNLNRCNFQKIAAVQLDSRAAPTNSVVTKIMLPFGLVSAAPVESLFMYLGEENFLEKIERAFNSSMSQSDKDHDLEVLGIPDRMPTFDPFLLRDIFETEQIEADAAYSEVSDDDFNVVRSRIIGDFELIVTKTLEENAGGSENSAAWNLTISAAAERLFKSLWYLDDLEALEPLARALGVVDQNTKEYFYAWKGLLFYVHGHSSSFSGIENDLASAARLALSDGRGDRAVVNKQINSISIEKEKLNRFFEAYESAFKEAFVDQNNTSGFLRILRNAKSLFWTVGTIIGRLDIYTAYFHRAREASRNRITAEDMRSFLRNMTLPTSQAPREAPASD